MMTFPALAMNSHAIVHDFPYRCSFITFADFILLHIINEGTPKI